MDYYIINTDARNLGYNPHDIWIEYGMAFTGYSMRYGEYLGKLKPNDICFMYVNQRGILAVGWVLEEWDGKTYDSPIVYTEMNEYRIKVDWFLDLRSKPISLDEVRDIVGTIFPRALQRIKDTKGKVLLDRCLEEDYSASGAHKSLDDSEPYESTNDGIFSEGKEVARIHKRRERNKKAVETKKKKVLADRGSLTCEVCGFDFAKKYGKLGFGFVECHHKIPLAKLSKGHRTQLSDLAIVCANCHRMLHRSNPMLSVEDLRKTVQEHIRVNGRRFVS
jgi:hypothetical protein